MPPSDLTPALVVVDSRNIFHQCDAATGFRLLPQVAGVVEAMRDYGFEALEVHVGLALPRRQDAPHLPQAAADNQAYKAQVEAHERGSVLLGELHRKDGGRGIHVEEKQVDVACAVDICRHAALMSRHDSPFKAIVVLSQDTDLTPSFRYAREVNVPLVVAAHERVERRGFDYLLLTERAFRSIGQIREPLAGHALRSEVARAASGPDRWDEWVRGAWDPSRQRVHVTGPGGLRGVVKQEHVTGVTEGDPVRLRIAGIDWGRRRRDFPLVTCSPKNPAPGHDHRSDLVIGEVRRRRAVTEVELKSAVGGRSRLSYPPGGLTSGSRVVVDVVDPKRPLLVGSLDPNGARDLMQAKPLCIEPFRQVGPTTTLAHADEHRTVLIAHKADGPPILGSRYAAVIVESTSRPVVKLVSSALP